MLSLWTVIALFITAVLVGCGGGGGGDAAEPAPVFTVQPVSQTVVAGGNVTFSVTVSGTGVTLQWQRSTDNGATWQDIAGAVAQAYTITVVNATMSGQQFRVAATSGSTTAHSSAVTLTVSPSAPPAITVQPGDATVSAGANATFSVTASGTSLNYQWQTSPDGIAWTNVAGATQATLSVGPVSAADNGRRYRVAVSNSAGSVTCSTAMLAVTAVGAAPVITVQPVAANAVVGQTATFSVSATGNPAPSLRWQVSRDGGASFSDIPGASAPQHTTGALQAADNGLRFRVIVSNPLGTVTSQTVVLTVGAGAAPTFTRQPTDQFTSFGDNDFAPNTTATFSAVVTGTPTPTLVWQVSTDQGRTFANINGATASSYTTPRVVMADGGKQFRLVATNASGTIASAVAALGVSYAGVGGESWGIALRPGGDIVTLVLPFVQDPWSRSGFGGLRQVSPTGRVSTLAGNDSRVYVDGAGPAASFRAPLGLVLDRSGNAFVIDAYAVRKVTPAGVVSTFAGSGTEGGFTDGTGTLARFGGTGLLPRVPGGIAVDAADNLYIADMGAFAIRKITPDGVVTTLAGGSPGTADGQGSAAKFTSLQGLTVTPAGDVFVIDVCLIRKISATGLVSTVTGTTGCGNVDGPAASARFNAPYGMASDATGNVYVTTLHGVRKISPTGIVSTLPGTSPGFGYTANRAIAADAAGNVFVTSGFDLTASVPGWATQIRKVSPTGEVAVLP